MQSSDAQALVLGIDAAWTARQPSGVALVGSSGTAWRLIAAEHSCGNYLALAGIPPSCEAQPLLNASASLGGRQVSLVAIDMPLARTPITARRPCDNAVSRAYGAFKCGTHSPNGERPGKISDKLRAGFEAAGYPLRTTALAFPGVIEVYPHPALVELARVSERLRYKAGKTSLYWPGLPLADRKCLLFEEWQKIVMLLDSQIGGVAESLQLPSSSATGAALKAFEDRLDAVVCAYVGIAALEGRAVPYGDEDSAVWVPARAAM